MQQRRLRLGDILDDYCPRERRITNHAVVAMIDEQVKQTRCSTCDADHEYKAAKVPPSRKKRSDAATGALIDGLLCPPRATGDAEPLEEEPTVDDRTPDSYEPPSLPDDAVADTPPVAAAEADVDEGPVHRRLIRATLPRPDGQSPERRPPDFTVRQPGDRGGREADGNNAGQRSGQGRRHGHAQGGSQPQRSGGTRQGSGGQRSGSGSGGAGNPGGPRGNRSGQGSGRGGGRKRGR
jgi:hypothetical protein